MVKFIQHLLCLIPVSGDDLLRLLVFTMQRLQNSKHSAVCACPGRPPCGPLTNSVHGGLDAGHTNPVLVMS